MVESLLNSSTDDQPSMETEPIMSELSELSELPGSSTPTTLMPDKVALASARKFDPVNLD